MFTLTTFVDTIRISPQMLSKPTLNAVHVEMDKKYPNRVIMDIGLVICRYGDVEDISDGICVAGDGGAHHEVIFKLIIFRPSIEEVCVGTIIKSTKDGITVSLGGFFNNIFIPAYWMLNPSHYESSSGLWVWTPNYDDDDNNDDGDNNNDDGNNNDNEQQNDTEETAAVKIKEEDNNNSGNEQQQSGENAATAAAEEEEGGDRFEMEIGAEIRFKVKSINFTRVTNTAKGVQATTTSQVSGTGSGGAGGAGGSSSSGGAGTTTRERTFSTSSVGSADGSLTGRSTSNDGSDTRNSLRKRSTSIDITDTSDIPASMHIIASICEDGLGLTSWWVAQDDDDEEEDEVIEE